MEEGAKPLPHNFMTLGKKPLENTKGKMGENAGN